MKQDYINLEENEFLLYLLQDQMPIISEGGKKIIIHKLIDKLDEKDREIIEMICYDHLSYSECAKIIGINKRNFRKKVKKIIKKMQYLWEEQKNGN